MSCRTQGPSARFFRSIRASSMVKVFCHTGVRASNSSQRHDLSWPSVPPLRRFEVPSATEHYFGVLNVSVSGSVWGLPETNPFAPRFSSVDGVEQSVPSREKARAGTIWLQGSPLLCCGALSRPGKISKRLAIIISKSNPPIISLRSPIHIGVHI